MLLGTVLTHRDNTKVVTNDHLKLEGESSSHMLQ